MTKCFNIFDEPVLQHTESDKSKFCPSTTLRCENVQKERSALPPLLLGPALQLGGALPSTSDKNQLKPYAWNEIVQTDLCVFVEVEKTGQVWAFVFEEG